MGVKGGGCSLKPKGSGHSLPVLEVRLVASEDVPASLGGSYAGVEASEDSLVTETTPAKASLVKGLIRPRFFGLKPVSTPPVVLKEKSLSSEG